MSAPQSSHAYGIGLLALLVGMSVVIVFYTSFYLPEQMAKPTITDAIANATIFDIEIVPGAMLDDGNDYSPKLSTVILGINNNVLWTNNDGTAHTVTPTHHYSDGYSGLFESQGVIKPGMTYSFLFTEPGVIEYNCIPHPWMTGTISVIENRF